jgi:hypothetical protein
LGFGGLVLGFGFWFSGVEIAGCRFEITDRRLLILNLVFQIFIIGNLPKSPVPERIFLPANSRQ